MNYSSINPLDSSIPPISTQQGNRRLLTVIALVFVVISLAAALYIINRPLLTQKKAEEPSSCQGENAYIWDGGSCPNNDELVSVIINTQTSNDSSQPSTGDNTSPQTPVETKPSKLCCRRKTPQVENTPPPQESNPTTPPEKRNDPTGVQTPTNTPPPACINEPPNFSIGIDITCPNCQNSQ